MKFRKSMSVAYVLFPIIMLSIALPVFYLSYTTKHANNMKKVLQEAAYTGSLAGVLALDINAFQNNKETPTSLSSDIYPTDTVTNDPVIFMKQQNKAVRKGPLISNQDILKKLNISPSTYVADNKNIAATEVVVAVEKYLFEALKDIKHKDSSGNLVYTYVEPKSNGQLKLKDDVYSISMYFERDRLAYINKKTSPVTVSNDTRTSYPFNKITVSVSLNYKPLMYSKVFASQEDKNNNVPAENIRIPIYGTSSARTKTIS